MKEEESIAASRLQASAAKKGLILFAFYLLLYCGFIGMISIDYSLLSIEVIPGINLAIAYGFGLIFAAIALAIVYGVWTSASVNSKRVDSDSQRGDA